MLEPELQPVPQPAPQLEDSPHITPHSPPQRVAPGIALSDRTSVCTARLKRIVGRHASLVEFTAYVNSVFTFIGILYVAHLVVSTNSSFSSVLTQNSSLCVQNSSI